METEEARHETEETLRFVTSSNIPQKLQNGCQSSEGEGKTWNHYTPNTVNNFMKRHRESSSPASVPGLLNPESQQINGEMQNGEMKHVLSDPSFQVHQPKKLKVDHTSLADSFNKGADFQCNVQPTQMNVDKRNYNLSNGDVFGLVKNKQMISNGATSPPSTIEGTAGDLLEKTLSQYFPEHISIAPQPNKTQINSVNGSDENRAQNDGSQRHFTSGLKPSTHMPVGYVMNGFSSSYGEDQHQQPQRQHQPSGCSRDQMTLNTDTVNTTQQHPNGPERYHEKVNFQGAGQKSNHNSFVNHNAPQYGAQPQRYQQNTGNIATEGMALQPPIHTELTNGIENKSLQGAHSWTERKSLQQQYMNAASPHSQEMWRNCSVESQQRTSSPQVQKPVQRLQAHGAFMDSSKGINALLPQQQDSTLAQVHYTITQQKNAPEWQQSQSKAPLQDLSFLHQTQIERSYQGNKQSEHSREQHMHPQRPLSQPPQYDGQQLKSPIYRPHSQPQPGHQPLSCQLNVNYTGEQLRQHLYSPNSGSTNIKQLPQQPTSNNHCQPTNIVDYPLPSAQNQLHLPQQAKSEQQKITSCSLQQPLAPGDFHRHTALRMHLLQKQERQGPPPPSQSPGDLKYGIKPIKEEHIDEFDFPGTSQPPMPIRLAQVKQEPQEFLCDQSKKQSSILASMEQSLKQYQLSPVFEKKSIVINSNKVKVESSGPVTILSTKTDLKREETMMSSSPALPLKRAPDSTPQKEHLLQCFMDSPMKLLDTPIKNLLDTPLKTQYDIASCHCVEQISEKDEGPYYTHLGSAPSVQGIRELMEKRSGLTGRAIRIEKVIYTGKEGKSTQGCPIAKWVIRRSSDDEKLLVLVRERNGHRCESACIIVAMLVWDGISKSLADSLYNELSQTLTKYGAHTQRRCALNEERTCACQGFDPEFSGASFSFGCSWSMYYNGCKFARSKIPRKFKLLGDDIREEERLENNFQNLATLLGPLYKTMAPEAYGNQVEHEHRGTDCRLGNKPGRPFSGVTACMDFCAHAHRDLHNMQGGSTVVCTLTREDNRDIGKIPEDEQLHVLPLYKPSRTDEFGSEEGQKDKVRSGAIQILNAFRRQVRMLAEPAKSCRQKKLEAKKAAAQKNAMLESEKADKALHVKVKQENSDSTALKAGPVPGVMGVRMDPGQPQHHPGNIPYHQHHLQQQPQQTIPPPYSGTANSTNFPRYPNHPGSFPSTSKSGNMYPPQPPTSASSYPSPHHLQSSYMNGSGHAYPGYQRNGSMAVGYPPFYGSNPKHLDMYQQRSSPLEQQYGVPQHYNYPPGYGEAGLQVNGYNPCGMGPVHPMRSPYPPYGPNGTTNPHYMDPHQRLPSAHGSLGNQFRGYQSPYLTPSPQILPPGQDPLQSPVKTEMASSHMLPGQVSAECQMPAALSALQNGNIMGPGIKQEPGTPQTPTTPQKPEVWSDNEHNFLDPDIGGVAVAPTHGSVLIECAKRELHATTPLKNPDRNHPTRISLVFYQHKNLNEAKHGLALWEAKMAEKAREKEEEAERNGGEVTPTKSGKKGAKREHSEATETGEPPYKRFIQSLLEGSLSSTTNTYVSTSPYAFTKVTGPYRQFV